MLQFYYLLHNKKNYIDIKIIAVIYTFINLDVFICILNKII